MVKRLFSGILAKFRDSSLLHSSDQAKIESDMQAGESAYEQGDYEAALRIFGPLAKQGDSIARFYLKLAYKEGKNILTDTSEDLKWCRKAAEQDLVSAQYDLGNLHINGNGIPRNYDEAAKWFYRAAVRGHATAQYNLGIMYTNGFGVSKNHAEGVKWYHKAAKQGLKSAQIIMGFKYTIGRSVSKNYVLAYMWLNLAVLQGNKRAAKIRPLIEKEMTPQQISKGQMLARQWNFKMGRSEISSDKRQSLSEGLA